MARTATITEGRTTTLDFDIESDGTMVWPGRVDTRLDSAQIELSNRPSMETVRVQFTLARPVKVNIRFYTVAGCLAHDAEVAGDVGSNTYEWTGSGSNGVHAETGVYFLVLSALRVEFLNNRRRFMLLGPAGL